MAAKNVPPCPPPLNFQPLVDWEDCSPQRDDKDKSDLNSSSQISNFPNHRKNIKKTEYNADTNINASSRVSGQGQLPVGSAMQFARNRQ